MKATKTWWQNLEFLNSCLENLNAANRQKTAIERCSYLLKALELSDEEYFKEVGGYVMHSHLNYFFRDEVRTLAFHKPQILNYQVLIDEGFNGAESITSDMKHKATREHRQLSSSWKNHAASSLDIALEILDKKLRALFETIENNIAVHDKLAAIAGKDKLVLDQSSYQILNAMLEEFFADLFVQPAKKLAAYGTLKPGESNYHIVDTIGGDWSKGVITGTLEEKDGYPHFTWKTSENKVKVDILESENLPHHWQRLDHFEGSNYERILIPVETEAGLKVCYVYNGI